MVDTPATTEDPVATPPIAEGSNAGAVTPPTKKPRAKKGAPITAETQVLESSPAAAEMAEGTEASDAAVSEAASDKQPRAKKAKPAEG